MAAKKKDNKAAGKTKPSKKFTPKGRLASGKKSSTKKVATKAKPVKAKKSAAPKKSTAKPKKPAASSKKANLTVPPKKKLAAPKKSKAKAMKAPSSVKKTKTAGASKKKSAASSSQAKKKKTTISKRKVAKKVVPLKGRIAKKVVPSKSLANKKIAIRKSSVPAKAKSSSKGFGSLSAQERYNAGGLCACVIETFTKDGQARLQRVLKHLGLSDMDQANLFRVSQGLRIPKLFADGLTGDETRRGVLQSLAQFAKADDSSSKAWKSDLEDLGRLLGA